MPITFLCPNCGMQHNAPDTAAGRQAKCKCGTMLMIPGGVPAEPKPVYPQAPAPGFSVGAPAAPYTPTPAYPGATGLGVPRRTGTAEKDLRILISLIAMGVGAYYAYFYGRALYSQVGAVFSLHLLEAIALLLAYLTLIAAGVMIVSNARPAATFTFVVAIIVAGLVCLKGFLLFIDIVRLSGPSVDPFGPGRTYGVPINTKLELFFNLFVQTLVEVAPPAILIWWPTKYK